MDYRRTKVEALVVLNNHLLMVKDVGPDGQPLWRLPAAELEEGEMPEDGVERALACETGFEGKVLEFIHRAKPKEGPHRLILTFRAELRPGQELLEPDALAREVKWRSLRNPQLRETLREVLRKAHL
ncbi:MAG: NUDIX hydrolase [Bacillota bacterium]|jgi:ADP-ribose pyrophosphatase YjhB (NUDIX family)